ncbi:MAG: hypothetical protein PHP45_06625 [Elusimicrobiales bacterium]|nr:hypothetical protein [Elusimicrobiales bacterium]
MTRCCAIITSCSAESSAELFCSPSRSDWSSVSVSTAASDGSGHQAPGSAPADRDSAPVLAGCAETTAGRQTADSAAHSSAVRV